MARPPKDPTGNAVQRTIRLTPSALAAIEAHRHGGESDSAVVNRLLTAVGPQDDSQLPLDTPSRERHPTNRPTVPTMPVPACPHIDYARLSFGWKCKDCGAVSRDFGTTWVAVPSGGGG